ncbi:MAG TPA: SCO family protein [Candidatus Limnocylindria bacterium]|nr:SCO family protein [Candidatus Limnocylindria bacterium]
MRATAALVAAATLVAALAGAAAAADRPALRPEDVSYTYGAAPFAPAFTPPPPGSYELPPIDTVADHAVLDADGTETTLAAVIGDRLAVVSFIYGSCAEAAGCPVSTAALHRLDRLLAADPALAREVRLVTVSFDPARDTPARMAAMRARHAPRSDWRFVTTRDAAMLQPLLDDFGQGISELRYPDGTPTGVFRHVLKVFLLDRRRRVRNVYSVGFLHPELVLNDLRTVR